MHTDRDPAGRDAVADAVARACRYVLGSHRDEHEDFGRTCQRITDMVEGIFLRDRLADAPDDTAHRRMQRRRLAADVRGLVPDCVRAWEAREIARLEGEVAGMRTRIRSRALRAGLV